MHASLTLGIAALGIWAYSLSMATHQPTPPCDCDDAACTPEPCLCCDTLSPEADDRCPLCWGEEMVPTCRQELWLERDGKKELGVTYGRTMARRALLSHRPSLVLSTGHVVDRAAWLAEWNVSSTLDLPAVAS